jgi:uncharacterized membrane protein YgdD (TMEM256/DUF423 family)
MATLSLRHPYVQLLVISAVALFVCSNVSDYDWTIPWVGWAFMAGLVIGDGGRGPS